MTLADGDLGERVRALVASVAALADELGYADARAEMEAVNDRIDERGTTLVVAGEANAGKSSLLNALVGRPHLLPTDHLVATNAPVVLRHGAHEGIAVWLEGEPAPRPAPLDELPRWATVKGEAARRGDGGDAALPVAAIEVTLDAPELADLMLVDTPGVGGLVAAHARVTLEALARADALMFVLPSNAPAGEQELDFLAKAAIQVPSVVVVLAKADGPRASWEAVLAEDRRLVGARLAGGGDWPIIPVSAESAVSAMEARAEGAEEEAQTFDAVSGLGRLREELSRQVVSRGRLLRQGRAVQLGGGALSRCAAGLEARRLAAADDDASRGELERQLAGVEDALAGDAPWRDMLRTAVSELSEGLERDATRRIESRLDWAYGSQVQREQISSLSDLVRDLDREVTALHGELRRRYTTELTRTVRKLQAMLGAEGLAGLVNDLAPPIEERDALPTVQGPSLFESIDQQALINATTAGIGAVTIVGGGLSTLGAGGAGAATAAAASPAASTALVASSGAGGSAAATHGGMLASAALGPALVVGAFVGVAALGLASYKNHKAAQVKRASDALERAKQAAYEILRDFLAQAEALGIDGTALVEARLAERRGELAAGQTLQDSRRRSGLAELEGVRGRLERLQDERAALRAAIAGRLAG